MDNPNAKFKKTYWIVTGCFFAVILGVLVYLWVSLAKYQASAEQADILFGGENGEGVGEMGDGAGSDAELEEEKAAQKAFETYVDGLTLEDYVNLYFGGHPERLDSVETVSAYISEKIVGADYKKYKARDFALAAPRYVIMADGETLAEFMMAKNGGWAVNNVNVLSSGASTISVKVPAGSIFTVNGHEFMRDFFEAQSTVAELYAYEEDLVNPVVFDNFSISGLLSDEAEVVVENAALACDGIFYEIYPEGTENKTKSEDFVKAMLHYSAMGKENTAGNQGAALSYVASGSNASKVIHETASGMEWVPANYSITYTVAANEPMKLADNCYFIDVDYTLTDTSVVAETEEPGEPGDGSPAPDAVSDGVGTESDSAESAETSGVDENSAEGPENRPLAPGVTLGVYRVYYLDQGDGYKIVEFAGVK